MRAVWVDGLPCEGGVVTLDVDDPGLSLGLTVFETLRTYDGSLFRPGRHLDRLQASAAALGLACPELGLLRAELFHAAQSLPGDLTLRLTLTGGGRRLLRAAPFSPAPGPARVALRPGQPPPWLDGRVKHGSRAPWLAAVAQAGVDEVIWLGEDGALLEGTRSNLFAVRGGVLRTPPDDGRILPGVTRGALLEAAAAAGLEAQEAALWPGEPNDELYLCSALRLLQPIRSVDGRPAPGEGPVGRALRRAFLALVDSERALD